MGGFERDVERSLALHRAVAEKLLRDPRVLEHARHNVQRWLERGGRSAPLLDRWRVILERSPAEIAAFLVDPSEEAAWLRKASPFAGILTLAERTAIIKATRSPEAPR
jgi:hypothetical protein